MNSNSLAVVRVAVVGLSLVVLLIGVGFAVFNYATFSSCLYRLPYQAAEP